MRVHGAMWARSGTGSISSSLTRSITSAPAPATRPWRWLSPRHDSDCRRRLRKLLAFTKAKSETVATLLAKHRDARILVFTADNEAAYEVARRQLIMPLTCDIGREER